MRASRRWLLFAILAASCTKAPVPYPEQIEQWHAEKDRFLREWA
jgi:hypothetical protein